MADMMADMIDIMNQGAGWDWGSGDGSGWDWGSGDGSGSGWGDGAGAGWGSGGGAGKADGTSQNAPSGASVRKWIAKQKGRTA